MSNPDDPASWLAKAANDLLCIDNNLQSPRVPWDVVSYHSQQAAEKALKAYLVWRQQTPPRTHDLIRLLDLCVTQGADFADLTGDCSLAVRYAAASRYPGDPYEPTAEEANEAVSAGKRIYQRVRDAIASGADIDI